jgi:hypothetical protein
VPAQGHETDGGNSSDGKDTHNPEGTQTDKPGDENEPSGQEVVKPEPEEVPASGDAKKPKAYMKGYEDNSFRPENKLTRAEMAAILAGIDGTSKELPKKMNFKDVSKDHWAAWAIGYVTEKGYFKGYGNNDFRPNQYITRGELSTVLCKYIGLNAANAVNEAGFKDINGHWAQASIEMLLQKGYIKGYPDGTFRPGSNIKRSECVAMMNRILGIEPIKDAEIRFTDVNKGYWAFGDIVAATLRKDE